MLILLSLFAAQAIYAQEDNIHQRSSIYEAPQDPLVKEKLEEWQGLKFGILIHWGVYAVPGIIESWQLCSEEWINRPEGMSYDDYKKWYWNLSSVFNPVNFDPDSWASASEAAGMKYVVFTTKHHDGFNMFDTQQTDYKITNGPFKNHPKANVAKHVFEAYRKKNFMIGAYFSKPDWHSQYFWWDKYATPNRNVNYNILQYPERWKAYQDFTFNQISELVHDYGSIDILWLDGGWVRPKETVNDEVRSWGAPIPEFSQEVNMPKIATMAREAQPGIIFADRTVHGPYENYQTPERKIPDERLEYPWETCMPLANNWGYVPNDPLKSTTKVIQNLVEVVAKGGNMLLGIGPQPDGRIPLEVVERMKEIGVWLNTNGEAIYNTYSLPIFQDGKTFFTENERNIYAIYCPDEDQAVPSTIQWKGNIPKKGSKIILLETGKPVKWTELNGSVRVNVPKDLQKKDVPALAFKFKK